MRTKCFKKNQAALRCIALLTLFFFTSTNSGLAELALVYSEAKPLRTSIHTDRLEANLGYDEAILPTEYGQIKKFVQGNRNKILIHIQDAHANEEAQRNIAKIIGFFADHHNLKTVALEGADGKLATDLLSFFPDKGVLRAVADLNLSKARMNGSEYAAIVEKPTLQLFGAEEDALYEKNRTAYLAALKNQKNDERILDELGRILRGLTRFVFSKKIRELRSHREQFFAEGRDLSTYVAYLIQTAKESEVLSLDEFPHMQSLLALLDLEETLDFDAAQNEVELLIGDLKKNIPREYLSRFLTNTVQYRLKKMKRSDYYSYLEAVMLSPGVKGLADKYNHVLSYLRYIRTYDSISLDIFDEIAKLETLLKNKFFQTQTEVKLDKLLQIFEVYQKLFDFSLSKQDADFFFAHRDDFNTTAFEPFLSLHR